MKRLILSLVVILLAVPVMAQRSIRLDVVTAPFIVASDPPQGPLTGYPMSYLRQLTTTGHITVRAITRNAAPWSNPSWLAEQRTSGSNLAVLILHARNSSAGDPSGLFACTVSTLMISAAPNQAASLDVDLSSFGSDDFLMFESWPRGYELHVVAPSIDIAPLWNLVPIPPSSDPFAVVPHSTWGHAGVCP